MKSFFLALTLQLFFPMLPLRFKPILTLLICSFSLQSHALFCRDLLSTPIVATMPSSNRPPALPVGLDIDNFPENTAARVYVEYAVRDLLLNQQNRSLGLRDLLLPNGGLCASSSITNILGSMMAQEHNFIHVFEMAPQTTHQLLTWYQEQTGLDGRLGANVPILTDIVVSRQHEILAAYSYLSQFHQVNFSVSRYHNEFFPYRMGRYLRGDSIGVLVVNPIEGPRKNSSYHAIVLLGVDLENNRLFISDPNNPNQIIAAPFEYTQGTNITFRVPFTYGSDRVEIHSLDVLTRSIELFD